MVTKVEIKSTVVWGFFLWLIGYLAGMILFFVVPKEVIGWVITPFAVVLTIWVIIKKIRRQYLKDYFGLGMMWMIMAVILDYIFLVKMLKTEQTYYKIDVFLYYILTLTLPIIVGFWKYKNNPKGSDLF